MIQLKSKEEKQSLSVFMVLTAVVFFLDQATKTAISGCLEVGQTLPVVPGFFHITYVRNPGAAFGVFPHKTQLFIVFTGLMLLLFLFIALLLSGKYHVFRLALALQVGGALGNFVDRLRFGYVIDFLDFQIWPVFNLADSAIVASILLVLILFWRFP